MIGRLATATLALLLSAGAATSHFQQLVPSLDVLKDGGEVILDLQFTHPMERGPIMQMERPARFGAMINGAATDLSGSLTERKIEGKSAWSAKHTLQEPGAAVYYVEPKPYWEASEGKFIIHYAKVVVDAFASGEGWDQMVGLPVEIQPLVRPTGVWTGNLFRGVVLQDAKPVPFANVEVEWVNDGSVEAPNDAFVPQVIKADANGVFAYAMPRAGWWGFAALIEATDKRKGPDGKEAPVELGALMWVKATDMGKTK